MATDLEVFRATTEHRRPPRILYHASFTEDLRRRVIQHAGTENLAGHYGLFAPANLPIKRPADSPPIDYSPYWEGQELPEGTGFDARGVAQVPSGFYHFWGYLSPLRNASSLAEIENYPLDEMSEWDFSYMAAAADAAHAAGRVVYGPVGHMYESAWQVRGYEQFLMDMIERPAWAECLLQRLAEQNMIKALACARAGADVLHCGDDVANQNAMMFAPQTWRRMMLSRWAKVWAAAKAVHPAIKVWYHSDGNILAIVGELIDAGVDILNPLQPECLDVGAVHRSYGGRVTLDGCIGTQSTMPWGKPADVKARVEEVIDSYGRDGGLMISPTHVLEPEVPIANIEALCDACRQYGAFE